MPWFVKIERGLVDKATFDRFVPAHKAYVQALNVQGRQASTGYWRDSRGGMLLFQAADWAEAQTIVEQDPLIANGCVTYELHEWVHVVRAGDG
ncbi:MAG: YciI family protein [Thermosynechococcaceae cyanobacterium]